MGGGSCDSSFKSLWVEAEAVPVKFANPVNASTWTDKTASKSPQPSKSQPPWHRATCVAIDVGGALWPKLHLISILGFHVTGFRIGFSVPSHQPRPTRGWFMDRHLGDTWGWIAVTKERVCIGSAWKTQLVSLQRRRNQLTVSTDG